MDIRHLRYFVAVVEEQSFTKASERLFIAQPPLSRQIQDLEQELGLQLLERTSRPIKTTEAGEFFYQNAKRVINNIEQMVSMTKRIGYVDQTVRIGYVGSLLLGRLPQIIREFRQLAPMFKVELVEMGTYAQIESLKKGGIDIGFGRLHFSDHAVRRILLRNEPLILAIHEMHPLIELKDKGVYLADIADEPMIFYPNTDQKGFSEYIINLFYEYGLEPVISQTVSQITLALGLVASGEGVCVVPQNSQAIQMNNLDYIPILDSGAVSPIYMSFRETESNLAVQLMLSTIANIYNSIQEQGGLIYQSFTELWYFDESLGVWRERTERLP